MRFLNNIHLLIDNLRRGGLVILFRVCMKKLVLKIVFLFFVVSHLFGQTVDLRFLDVEYENNISTVFYQAIAQDADGFMWFGTTNGLQRFDGYEMKNYLSSDNESFGINEYNINKLYADKKGLLWISLSSKLCCYNIESDSIVLVGGENKDAGLDSYYIYAYAEDADSNLYICTATNIYRYNRSTKSFKQLVHLANAQISSLVIDSNNDFWIGTNNNQGLYKYSRDFDRLSKINLQFSSSTVPSIMDVELYMGYLWLATYGDGVWRLNLQTGDFKKYPVDNDYAMNVMSLYIDNDGYLWSVDLTGIKLFVKDRDLFQGYYPEEGNEYSVRSYVKDMMQDRDYNYWTIHSPGSISFSPRSKKISRFNAHMNSSFKLTYDNVSSINEDKYGNLWIANPFNGIDIFKWSEGRTVSYIHNDYDDTSLGKGAIMCLFRDSKQQMWIGSYWGGLQRYRENTNDFESYNHIGGRENEISGSDVRSIVEDKHGNLWLAIHGKGLDKFNPVTKVFTHYNFADNNLANDFTFHIAIDSSNNVWVGTAWGLSFLADGDSVCVNYQNDADDPTSISSNLVNALYIDEKNRLWLGTPRGLNLFLPDSGHFMRISDGFANKNIVSITEDRAHNIWMGTYYGITRYNPENGSVLNLNKDDGLISNDFYERAIFRNDENTLFFGSIDGINYFNPEELEINQNVPDVYITKLKILNSEVSNINSSIIDKNITKTKEIILAHSDKIIEFEFTTTSFVSSHHNKYAYYLEGFEDGWNQPSLKRNVTYTNLDPGKYVFHVKAANNEGTWNETGTSMSVIITPPFWDTIAFKIFIVVFLIGLTLSIIKIRERTLLNDKIILERKVSERTATLNQQKEELEMQKLLLEDANNFKSKFFSVLAHDLRGPITNIVQFASLLRQKMKANQFDSLGRIIELNYQSANGTRELLDDLLIWGKAQSDNILLNCEQISINEIIEAVIQSYVNLAKQKDIVIQADVADGLYAYADSQTVKTMLRNLVSNAIKFSFPESKVIIAAIEFDKMVQVSVTDFGVGMEPETLETIANKGIKHSSMGTAGEKGTGMGLKLILELVKLNEGEIYIDSEMNKGTTVRLLLPREKKVSTEQEA